MLVQYQINNLEQFIKSNKICISYFISFESGWISLKFRPFLKNIFKEFYPKESKPFLYKRLEIHKSRQARFSAWFFKAASA